MPPQDSTRLSSPPRDSDPAPRTQRSKLQIVRYILLAVIGFGVGFGVIAVVKGLFNKPSDSDSAAIDTSGKTRIDWATLRGLDNDSRAMTPELKKLDGTVVEIPGFMVPLEDEASKVSEFLLVPSPQACIHVPPPPPNQMVHVKMASGRSTNMAFGPIWLVGKMQITDYAGPYGTSAFFVTGISTRPYD